MTPTVLRHVHPARRAAAPVVERVETIDSGMDAFTAAAIVVVVVLIGAACAAGFYKLVRKS
ncbi:MAG: hypothetical protein ACR2FG_11030 [Marmoricola sp.]